MTPAFGFSVGDFISAIELIKKISKALKDTGGASAEYQSVIIELKALENVLRNLETLEPTEDNIRHVNAVRGMALACQLPLRDFMVKLERYETSLGPWSERTALGSAGRKAKWAASFAKEVEKIRTLVAAKHISISLLLATHSSQTLSKIHAKTTREHGDLMTQIAEQRATLQHLPGAIWQLKENVKDEATTTRTRLDAILSTTEAIQTSVLSLRNLGDQIMQYIGTFPREIRNLLRTIMRSNWQMYRVLLQIQANTSPSPTMLRESNIRFEDAMGDYRELPYEFFRHWEPFEGFLRTQFKDKPGEKKILKGLFHVIDLKNNGVVVKKEHWHRSISPGAVLTMSMIMSYLRRKAGSCPRPDCIGAGITECEGSNLLICGTCRLRFYPISTDTEDSRGYMETAEDEQITRKQAEEDLRLYGCRPEPPDAVEVDEATQLAELRLPPLRSASEFSAVVDRPAEARQKKESKIYNYQAITALDWNSGASPLDAWLNQSAMPSTFAIPERQNEELEVSEADLVAQEVREINVFRNVHVEVAPPDRQSQAVTLHDMADLPFGAQIYYRNIMDRYPYLQRYLARRFASANFDRAERLRLALNKRSFLYGKTSNIRNITQDVCGDEIKNQMIMAARLSRVEPHYTSPEIATMVGHCPTSQRSIHERVYMLPCSELRGSASSDSDVALSGQSDDCKLADLSIPPIESKIPFLMGHGTPYPSNTDGPLKAPIRSELNQVLDQQTRSTPTSPNPTPPGQPHIMRDSSPDGIPSKAHSFDLERHSSSDLWYGGRPSIRRGSSVNSSLRGRPAFDLEEQDPVFPKVRSEASSGEFGTTYRGLPPPPVKLHKNKKLSFSCDICGDTVQVERRLEWQEHVFADLQPYMCTSKECDLGHIQYVTRAEWSSHELHHHSNENLRTEFAFPEMIDQRSLCPFCSESLGPGRLYGKHVGRHMEEIAFTVVTKPYEDWDFYSNASSKSNQTTEDRHGFASHVCVDTKATLQKSVVRQRAAFE